MNNTSKIEGARMSEFLTPDIIDYIMNNDNMALIKIVEEICELRNKINYPSPYDFLKTEGVLNLRPPSDSNFISSVSLAISLHEVFTLTNHHLQARKSGDIFVALLAVLMYKDCLSTEYYEGRLPPITDVLGWNIAAGCLIEVLIRHPDVAMGLAGAADTHSEVSDWEWLGENWEAAASHAQYMQQEWEVRKSKIENIVLSGVSQPFLDGLI